MYRNNFLHQGTGDFQYRSVATERAHPVMTTGNTRHTLLIINTHEMHKNFITSSDLVSKDIRREGLRAEEHPIAGNSERRGGRRLD